MRWHAVELLTVAVCLATASSAQSAEWTTAPATKSQTVDAPVVIAALPRPLAGTPPVVAPLGVRPKPMAVKPSHYYKDLSYPGKGYGWWAHAARRWKGYGPHGTGAYRGFGYGFNMYPTPYRSYKFGYPQNTLGPGNVGNGYIYYTYFGEGYPGWKYWPGRTGAHW